jgi:serine carboxypeptidase-like clade 2
LAVGLASVVNALPEEDRVTELDQMQPTGYNMFSGFMDLNNTNRKIHYVFVDSQNNNETDPLLIWFNGGPGCSSWLGFMQENGPYKMEDGQDTFQWNEYSWNKKANVLYIDQPAGVGFSTCTGNCSFDDYNASEDNVEALLKWYEKFPEYKKHDLYISGESYAGIYIPYLMWQIDMHNNNQTVEDQKVPLKGILVGNGCTNWTYDALPASIDMYYWRSLLDEGTYQAMKNAGCDYSGIEFDQFSTSPECQSYLDRFHELT